MTPGPQSGRHKKQWKQELVDVRLAQVEQGYGRPQDIKQELVGLKMDGVDQKCVGFSSCESGWQPLYLDGSET